MSHSAGPLCHGVFPIQNLKVLYADRGGFFSPPPPRTGVDLSFQWKAKSFADKEATLTMMKKAQVVLLNKIAPLNSLLPTFGCSVLRKEWLQEAALSTFLVACSAIFWGHNLGIRLSVLGSIPTALNSFACHAGAPAGSRAPSQSQDRLCLLRDAQAHASLCLLICCAIHSGSLQALHFPLVQWKMSLFSLLSLDLLFSFLTLC